MENLRNEYPRPQFVRENWMNLNGEWDFLFDFGNSGCARELWRDSNFYAGDVKKINVPFCPESRLSGIEYTDWMNAVWYRRTFNLDNNHLNGRILLHFGAVDYHCIAYINGKPVGSHVGGYSSFTFDVTDAVCAGENSLTVYAEDNNRSGIQPMGKQSMAYASSGCSYTRTTGIWQTVWLEFVPENYIVSQKITPFVDEKRVLIELDTVGGQSVTAEAYFAGKKVGGGTSKVASGRAVIVIELDEVWLWDIRQPNLYDLVLKLDGEDTVKSYFGMRKIELTKKGIKLNDRLIFMRTVLDQGFNPDGIYTAPNDEFLKHDIELSMDLGFDGARLHQRVFEERTLYWADKLGYIVWGEYGNGSKLNDASGIANLLPEWIETLNRDYSHPSIIGWVPENESYWRRNVNPICQKVFYSVTKEIDPYRPVVDASGGIHFITDIFDIHEYTQNPETLKQLLAPMLEDPAYCHNPIHQEQLKQQVYRGQPVWISEYGGIHWSPEANDGWGYGSTPKSEEEFAQRYVGLTTVLLEHPRICGFCYTQLTDVEQEQNGLYKYDRSRKFNDSVYDRIRKVNATIAEIEKMCE